MRDPLRRVRHLAALLGLGLILVGIVVAADPTPVVPAEALAVLRQLPVQDHGRVKPFDSFARETLQRITGAPQVGHDDPVATVVAMMASPDRWQDVPLVDIPFRPLQEALGLAPKTRRVSYNALVSTRALMRRLPPIVEKQSRDEPLAMLEQETMDAYERFVAVSGLWQQSLALVPPPPGSADPVWRPILTPEGYPQDQQAAVRAVWSVFLAAAREGPPEKITTTARALAARLQALNPSAVPPRWRLSWEVGYNRAQPFAIACAVYAIAAAALLVSVVGTSPLVPQGLPSVAAVVGTRTLWLAFALHAAGIASRVVLGGRPPVSNFYETMLWLPFVAVVVSLVMERVARVRFVAAAAALLAAIVLLLAAHVPLDSSIAPVVAVLRSNLWLTIHVLTVVASYGALALAAVVAHLYAALHLARRQGHPLLVPLSEWLYHTIQVGVVLLAAGIMLGAVWANASWGRYWGWDPKETWALITLLWFLALLHGRMAGWLAGLGLAAGTIAGLLLLLMTYYGVSFYLVGLHSYAGGHAKPLPPLLIGFILVELGLLAVLGATALARRRVA